MQTHWCTWGFCVLLQAIGLALLNREWRPNFQLVSSFMLLAWPSFFVLASFSEDRWKKWRHLLAAAILTGITTPLIIWYLESAAFRRFSFLCPLPISAGAFLLYVLWQIRSDTAIRSRLRSAARFCALLFLWGLAAAAFFFFSADSRFIVYFSGPCAWGDLLGVLYYLCYGTLHYFLAFIILGGAAVSVVWRDRKAGEAEESSER